MAETREPDRFEAKECDVYAAPEYATEPIACIAAALRAAESSALERAARIARRYSHHAEREIRALIPPAAEPAADSALESMCDCGRHVEGEKYALPAGGHVRAAHVDAPAAETGTCANFWHPGRGHEIHARRAASGDLSAPHEDHVNDSGCLNWKPAAAAGKAQGAEALSDDEQVKRLTAAMREADRAFEQVGGSTRHHVRDCLLPVLEKHGLRLVAASAAPSEDPAK